MVDFYQAFRKLKAKSASKPTGQGTGGTNAANALPASLAATLSQIETQLGGSTDLVIRRFVIRTNRQPHAAAVVYIESLSDPRPLLESLLVESSETQLFLQPDDNTEPLRLIREYILKVGDIGGLSDLDTLFHAILSGDSVVLIDGHAEGIVASTRACRDRGVDEPSSQSVVRGPREGFTETLRTNSALIRRKIKDANLWMETRQIGKVTMTDVAIMYIRGIANDKIVEEVRRRLDRIDIDGILESGYIEELIQDETYTPFPTMYNSERPDAIAGGLLEGRIAILVDGTPFVLLVPALFAHFLQTPEDYYQRADIASLLRILRYVCLFIAMFGPSAYIAITTFHQEMIPTPLLISVVAQREGIPFPAFIEALLMEITFEILREAGVRMPRTVGQAVSIVGALVIGQAAVDAGLVGPAMVIVVAITAISNFVIPSYNMGISIRMIRFVFMMLAASFGLYGILVGTIIMILHLCSLRSFGIPYMAPFAPYAAEDQKDSIFRVPQWAMLTRPRLISQTNRTRQQSDRPRKPPSRG
ncbi:spore germination protein KA [Paenibacillus sp. UNC496MF]|uniref:spore germination protein n=1 Tax=Paenibacillus sp. UNC496MF TaxID=1502753 RepID=UPI0008DFC36C|nr:spore germination protein [Paenibacillus sp. UNC496MF]SFJ21602.1 spore germination protein KA [Paenibacillus sp. UNC496MF]